MNTNRCYACHTPIPQLRMEGGGRYVFRCTYCGCETKANDLEKALYDWNEGHTYPPSCRNCVHGDGTYKPCGKENANWHFMVACAEYRRFPCNSLNAAEE